MSLSVNMMGRLLRVADISARLAAGRRTIYEWLHWQGLLTHENSHSWNFMKSKLRNRGSLERQETVPEEMGRAEGESRNRL